MQRKLLTILFVFALFGFLKAKTQRIYIYQSDGTIYTYEIEKLRTLTYSNSYLYVNPLSGTSSNYSLSSLKKILFKESTGVNDICDESDLSLYYNSSSVSVVIKNITGINNPVKIYHVNGILKISTTISSGEESIDVSSLSAGIYIVKVNHSVLKFVKL